jgi:hypothetical protein
MREPELTSIIDRLKHEVDANSIYAKQIELLIDLINYGSNLIARAYSTSKRNIDDIMIIAVLLKHIVQMAYKFLYLPVILTLQLYKRVQHSRLTFTCYGL